MIISLIPFALSYFATFLVMANILVIANPVVSFACIPAYLMIVVAGLMARELGLPLIYAAPWYPLL